MVIERRDVKKVVIENISKYSSGTVVVYGTEEERYGLGIILKDCDDENTIIFDLEEDKYYDDYKNYYVHEVLYGKFVIE